MISALASYASSSSSTIGSSNICVSPMAAMAPRQRQSQPHYLSSSRVARVAVPDVALSAPAYTEDAPPRYESIVAASCQPSTTVQATTPNKLAKLVLGNARAQKAAECKAQKQARRIEEAHNAWAAVGVDTRSAMARGEALPPHFFNAPRCSSLQGMDDVISRELGL